MMTFVAGFVLGMAGSAHCVAMCGPLVLTIARNLRPPSRRVQFQQALLYNAGRVCTYAVLAAPAVLAGQALVLWGLGRVLTVTAGLLLLSAALGSSRPRVFGRAGAACSAAAARACLIASRWSGARPVMGPLLTGAANGLVPCGLVYAALTAAAAAGSAADGLVLMIAFGLGTVPALVGLSLTAAAVPLGVRVHLRRLAPVALALAGALLLFRGLTLPEASPHHHPEPAIVADR